MRQDPIISGAWIKAALVILVGGALGVGAYLLATDVDINLPDLDLDTTAETTLSDTTIEATTIARPEPTTTRAAPKPPQPTPGTPGPPAAPTIEELQQLNRCVGAAGGDIDKVTACFDRLAG